MHWTQWVGIILSCEVIFFAIAFFYAGRTKKGKELYIDVMAIMAGMNIGSLLAAAITGVFA